MRVNNKIICELGAILMLVALIGVTGSAYAAMRCEDALRDIEPYNRDFGPGVFIQKINSSQFHIEPPPFAADSARTAHRKIAEIAKGSRDDKFTVTFEGFSELEVVAFKAMLRRDARIEADNRLSMVLLATETGETSDKPGYEQSRDRALVARDYMLRRYDWTSASVRRIPSQAGLPIDVYRVTVEKSNQSEGFLLSLHLRAVQSVKDRTKRIMVLLARDTLISATVEQMANTVIAELKKADKGISDGTLKVMAADFTVSCADRVLPE